MSEAPSNEYRMPSLGADMEDGRVVEWHVKPGDAVHRGDVVGVVDTAKGAIEMEIWQDAVVDEIVVPPGEKVPVGAVLLRLREAAPDAGAAESAAEASEPSPGGEPTPAEPAAPAEGAPSVAPEPAAAAPHAPPTPTAPAPRPSQAPSVRASPAARREARRRGLKLEEIRGSGPGGAVQLDDVLGSAERLPRWPKGEVHATPLARSVGEALGVDLASVSGSGPGGLVTREDVEAAAETSPTVPAAAKPAEERVEAGTRAAPDADRLRAMRAAIAAAMARSKREIPHYYLATSVSMLGALKWLESENARRSPDQRILPVTLFVKAVALALPAFPEFNGHWIDGSFRPAEAVHPGLAISLRGGGLVAPAIRNADERSLDDLSAAVTDLVQRARAARLRSSEMTEGTLTVTSLGDRGVEVVYGVIYPPQVALVGFGRVSERPRAEGGMLGVAPMVDLTLAADHRVSDGHRGGLFLEEIADRLQRPEEL